MRLYKKAAVCLLAAAMAVSMMTACGGGAGGGSNDGAADSKPGTSQGQEKDDDKKDDDKKDDDKKDEENTGDDQKDSVIPADPSKVTWDTSLTKKAFQSISKDNFRFSGLYGSGDAIAYATQGKKMLLVEQEDTNQFMAFYTSDGSDLYIAAMDKLPESVSQITGWQTAEEFGKTSGATADEIAKEKAETLADMTGIKEMVYFVDGVQPAAFTATINDPYYEEVMENVKVGNKAYTYVTLFTTKSVGNHKAGDLYSVYQTDGSKAAQIVLGSKITACDANTFPKVK